MPPKIHDNCYGCIEWFYTCNRWPENKPFACDDFRLIPMVGVDGGTGQPMLPSKMHGRAEPKSNATPAAAQAKPIRTRAPGPKAVYSEDGVRRCKCGVAIGPKKRCCNECRDQRKKDAAKRQSSPSPNVARKGSGLPQEPRK